MSSPCPAAPHAPSETPEKCLICGADRPLRASFDVTLLRDAALAARAYLDARATDGKALEEERGADAITTGQAVYHARLRLEAALAAVGMTTKQQP